VPGESSKSRLSIYRQKQSHPEKNPPLTIESVPILPIVPHRRGARASSGLRAVGSARGRSVSRVPSTAKAASRPVPARTRIVSAAAADTQRRRGDAAAVAVVVEPQVAARGQEEAPSQLGWVIANHVRNRRREIGLNVGQLAERSGISKGMLSKIENALTSPSLSTLERLASALDMPVTALFRGLAEERDAVYVKAGSGPEIVRQGTRAGHMYHLLGSLRGPYKRVEPLLVSLTESSEVFPLFQHPGIEIIYMLKGRMEYSYGKQRYVMGPGDTLQFEGDIPHGPTELIRLPIRFLSITVYGGERP
jgi:transcriptional regulator with XRE-family HTH domain